jgi:hypothetical protein
MKYIIITSSFQKQLKRFKKYLTEQDIAEDIKKFIQRGFSKGETYLENHTILTVSMEMVKLRICVYQVNFRYIIGIIDEIEYLPIIIDLKKGRYGKNLSFKADKHTVQAIKSATLKVISDYLEHTEDKPRYIEYIIKESSD